MEITPEALAAKQARMAQGKARTIAQLKAMGMSDARAALAVTGRVQLASQLGQVLADIWRDCHVDHSLGAHQACSSSSCSRCCWACVSS